MEKSKIHFETLVTKTKKNDTEAFTKIYQNYNNTVYFIAMQFFYNEEIAKDIVQDVFIRIFNKYIP